MTVNLPSDQQHQLDRARHPERALMEAVERGDLKMSEILQALGVDPHNPAHQAALIAADKYDLDPILKEVIVIPKAGPYITRDGWLKVAHRSGQFDGMEVVEQGENPTHWHAKVAVYRKDMGRPFTYLGRYPKSGSNKQYGPEMAVKVAEVAALRRAFPLAGVGAGYEEHWEHAATSTPVTADEIIGPVATDNDEAAVDDEAPHLFEDDTP